jgi:hypothetical protein
MPDVEATFGKTRRCFQQRQPMGEKGETDSGRILRRTKTFYLALKVLGVCQRRSKKFKDLINKVELQPI